MLQGMWIFFIKARIARVKTSIKKKARAKQRDVEGGTWNVDLNIAFNFFHLIVL